MKSNEWKISPANPNIVDPATRREIISFGKNAGNHKGGTITFGPDGYLYLGLGDGGNANDVGPIHIEPGGNAQNLSTPLRRRGELPQDMDEVMRRNLDIRFSSRMPLSDEGIKKLAEMKSALTRLLAKLPPSFKNDPDVQKLAPVLNVGEMTIARVTNRGLSHAGYSMDYEFSRATVKELWAMGLEDVRRSVASIESMQPTAIGCIARLYDLPPGGESAEIGQPTSPREPTSKPEAKPETSPQGARRGSLRRAVQADKSQPRTKRLAKETGRSRKMHTAESEPQDIDASIAGT